MFGVFGGAMGHGTALHVGVWPGWWAALIQLVSGVLVLIGFATRPAAILASGSMAFAYFTVHQERALLPIQNGGEPAAMFCWAFLLIAIIGPGVVSVDGWIARRLAERRRIGSRTLAPVEVGGPVAQPSGAAALGGRAS